MSMITCGSCGASNEEGTYFCEKCGKLLDTPSVPSAPNMTGAPPPPSPMNLAAPGGASPPPPVNYAAPATPRLVSDAAPGARGGSFCAKCGTPTVAGAPFCPGCGARLAAPEVTLAKQRYFTPSSSAPPPSAPVPAPQFAPPGVNLAAPKTAEPSRKIAEFKVSPFSVDWNLMIAAYGPLRSGKLEIFTDKIQFTPGKLNVADPAHTIAMSDVVSVEPCAVMMMPTGVKISARGGESFTYIAGVTGKREQLVEIIRRQMAALGA